MKSSKRVTKLKYWQEINQAYEVSGLKIKAFCLSQNIHYKNFLNYRYRANQINANHQDTSSSFIPVAIKIDSEATKNQIMVNSSNHSSLVLQLGNTIKLQIPIEAVNSDLLRTVFSALELV